MPRAASGSESLIQIFKFMAGRAETKESPADDLVAVRHFTEFCIDKVGLLSLLGWPDHAW